MKRVFRTAILTAPLLLIFSGSAAEDDYGENTYLDGFVGVGGALVQQFNSEEEGTRANFHVEFARIRKWISLDARVGLGKNYTDFGGVFRLYRHWNFEGESTTGISLGLGVGAMYSQGVKPATGDIRLAFIDLIAAPFVRYIWDWGNGVGLGFDLEYQAVPATIFTDDSDTDLQEDIRDLRNRVYVGLSLLFEVD